MDESTQLRFRPLIEKRIAAVAEKLPSAPAESIAGALVATPTAKDLSDELVRLQHALRRLEGGFYGRCIRCGRDLPVKRLERELDAVTCDPCPTSASQITRPAQRHSSFP